MLDELEKAILKADAELEKEKIPNLIALHRFLDIGQDFSEDCDAQVVGAMEVFMSIIQSIYRC